MTQVVLAFLSFLNGYGFASSLIQDREIDPRKVRQAFGMLLLVNGAIALIQLASPRWPRPGTASRWSPTCCGCRR